MQRWIIEQNIAHYRQILGDDLSDKQREILKKLLAEEETKLTRLGRPPPTACSAAP